MARARHRALSAAFLGVAGVLGAGDDLAPPLRIEAGGRPIDVDIGHAAPFICDLDGDGLRDLLVGQFGKGKLRVYRNVGTNSKPAYDGFTYFQAGGKDATVPAA